MWKVEYNPEYMRGLEASPAHRMTLAEGLRAMIELMKTYKHETKKRASRKDAGFTLMELLIVIAIIVVLVAIAIPVFTAQLDRAKDAADQANGRAVYAIVMADYMDDDDHTLQYDYIVNYDPTVSVTVSSTEENYPTQTITFSDRVEDVVFNFSDNGETPPTVEIKSAGNDGAGWIFGDAYGGL